jgi:hypothetical protein
MEETKCVATLNHKGPELHLKRNMGKAREKLPPFQQLLFSAIYQLFSV